MHSHHLNTSTPPGAPPAPRGAALNIVHLVPRPTCHCSPTRGGAPISTPPSTSRCPINPPPAPTSTPPNTSKHLLVPDRLLLLLLLLLRRRHVVERLLDGQVVGIHAGERGENRVDVVGVSQHVSRRRSSTRPGRGGLLLLHGHLHGENQRRVFLVLAHGGGGGAARHVTHGERESPLQQGVLVHHHGIVAAASAAAAASAGSRGGHAAHGGRRRLLTRSSSFERRVHGLRLLPRALLLQADAQRQHQRRVVAHAAAVHAVEPLQRRLAGRRRRRRRKPGAAARHGLLVHEDGGAEQHVGEHGAGRHRHQVAVVVLVHRRHERLQLLGVVVDVTEAHHVHRHVALAQLLPHAH
mmetsp:Transcript_30499/g.75805  ORF Transcript_30499/g.75805 Transcript_30499/m.75805 type:complete len:353 (+) Transcript_30499:296-1354(+)